MEEKMATATEDIEKHGENGHAPAATSQLSQEQAPRQCLCATHP